MMISTSMMMTMTTKMTDTKNKRNGRSGARSARRMAREFALQGVYAWILRNDDADLGEIDAHLRDSDDFHKADFDWYHTLLKGATSNAESLRISFSPFIDRDLAELSPIEHAILLIGSYELTHHIEVPYKVAINESVELAKSFGGTDGYRFVNGVLDKLAAQAREAEFQAASR